MFLLRFHKMAHTFFDECVRSLGKVKSTHGECFAYTFGITTERQKDNDSVGEMNRDGANFARAILAISQIKIGEFQHENRPGVRAHAAC